MPRKKKPNRPKKYNTSRQRLNKLGLSRILSDPKARAEFGKLQAKWYSKLSNFGFHDLEWLDKSSGMGQNTPFLSKSSASDWQVLNNSNNIGKLDYFRMAQCYLEHASFESTKEKRIWRLHCQGLSCREIERKLKSLGVSHGTSRTTVSNVLQKLRPHMILFNQVNPNGLHYTDESESDLSNFIESNNSCF